MIIPNLLLIAGTGNKSGKTTFACKTIEKFRDSGITGIKITPHFHETTPGLILLSEETGYSLYEETDARTDKDTSRMLAAGAARVFFIKVRDNNLLEAFTNVYKMILPGTPVVCESPALRHFAEPGLFVIMESDIPHNNKDINNILKFPHVMIHLKDLLGSPSLPIQFSNNRWIYT